MNPRFGASAILSLVIHVGIAGLLTIPNRRSISTRRDWIEVHPIHSIGTGSAVRESSHPEGASKAPAAPSPPRSQAVAPPNGGNYLEALRSWLIDQSHATPIDSYSGSGGTALLRIRMDDAGRFIHIELVNSSGNPRLDLTLMRWLNRLPAFQKPPIELGPSPIELEVPFVIPPR